MNFKQWDEQYKDITGETETNFKEVPQGNYIVSVDNLELTASKTTGAPMLSGRFKITEGDYKGSCIFLNQVLTTNLGIKKSNDLLRDLTKSDRIQKENFEQYANLINTVFNHVKDRYEYQLEYTENNGYKNFKIVQRFEKQ